MKGWFLFENNKFVKWCKTLKTKFKIWFLSKHKNYLKSMNFKKFIIEKNYEGEHPLRITLYIMVPTLSKSGFENAYILWRPPGVNIYVFFPLSRPPYNILWGFSNILILTEPELIFLDDKLCTGSQIDNLRNVLYYASER